MNNPLSISCANCQDVLTQGELDTNFIKNKGLKFMCYQCSQAIIKAKMEEIADDKKEPPEWNDTQENLT